MRWIFSEIQLRFLGKIQISILRPPTHYSNKKGPYHVKLKTIKNKRKKKNMQPEKFET